MGAERTLAARDLQEVNGLLVPMPKKPEERVVYFKPDVTVAVLYLH